MLMQCLFYNGQFIAVRSLDNGSEGDARNRYFIAGHQDYFSLVVSCDNKNAFIIRRPLLVRGHQAARLGNLSYLSLISYPCDP